MKATQFNLLTAQNYPDISSRILATKNIRAELKLCFPGVKFSIKSDSFAGGDSIDVHWVDGPIYTQVVDIISKYQYGSFNSMEDMYEYTNGNFCSVFGGAKYVHYNRSVSDKLLSKAIAVVNTIWKRADEAPATIEEFNEGVLDRRYFQGNSSEPITRLVRNYVSGVSEFNTIDG